MGVPNDNPDIDQFKVAQVIVDVSGIWTWIVRIVHGKHARHYQKSLAVHSKISWLYLPEKPTLVEHLYISLLDLPEKPT